MGVTGRRLLSSSMKSSLAARARACDASCCTPSPDAYLHNPRPRRTHQYYTQHYSRERTNVGYVISNSTI